MTKSKSNPPSPTNTTGATGSISKSKKDPWTTRIRELCEEHYKGRDIANMTVKEMASITTSIHKTIVEEGCDHDSKTTSNRVMYWKKHIKGYGKSPTEGEETTAATAQKSHSPVYTPEQKNNFKCTVCGESGVQDYILLKCLHLPHLKCHKENDSHCKECNKKVEEGHEIKLYI